MWLCVIFVVFGNAVGENQNTEEQQNLLPQYTQLDDYDNCLSKNNGLYCFGSFRIHPNHNANETYNFIKEYSEQKLQYDRTIFHRGYCVSSRCPPHSNHKIRFEQCVQEGASNNNLNISLEKLHYCKTQKKTAVLYTSEQAFMLTIFLILTFNLVGTLIDLKTKNGTKRFWTAWSVRLNWKQLMEPFGNDPDRTALAPIQVLRVVLMASIIAIHVVCISAESYMDSPLRLEKLLYTPARIAYAKIISSVQIFYVLSSFLTSYNLLLLTKKQNIGLWMLPKQFLKRYFRIAPIHLLFVWFAATWWPHISDGPVWSKVHTESAVCRKKLWFHLLHINNIIVEGDQHCLAQTWSLAADIQFQLISLILTLSMVQYRFPQLKILVGLFISSCALNASLAYVYKWKPMVQFMNDFNLADGFRQEYTYSVHHYISPYGSLPSCLIGLIMGHVYFLIRQKGFQLYKNKVLRLICRYSLPFLLLWVSAGWWTTDWENPVVTAFYLAIERPMFCIPPILWLFGVINGVRIYPGFKKLSQRIWMPLGRLSLSVLMLHWVIIETRIWSSSQPNVITTTTMLSEILVVWCMSYALAVPITILVEMPIINTYDYISKIDIKLLLQYKHVAKQEKQE